MIPVLQKLIVYLRVKNGPVKELQNNYGQNGEILTDDEIPRTVQPAWAAEKSEKAKAWSRPGRTDVLGGRESGFRSRRHVACSGAARKMVRSEMCCPLAPLRWPVLLWSDTEQVRCSARLAEGAGANADVNPALSRKCTPLCTTNWKN